MTSGNGGLPPWIKVVDGVPHFRNREVEAKVPYPFEDAAEVERFQADADEITAWVKDTDLGAKAGRLADEYARTYHHPVVVRDMFGAAINRAQKSVLRKLEDEE